MASIKVRSALTAGACVVVSAAAWAGDFDGSKQLICATTEAHSCDPGEACERNTPKNLGLPSFIRIDFQKKAMVGPQRSSPIQVMEKSESQFLLMGTELGFAWTVVLDQTDGTISGTLINRDETFVFFGSCTPV